jgi:hypothetical protein
MPIRTTSELVAAICEVDEDIPLAPFISLASTLVDRVSAAAEESGLLADGPNSDDKTRDDKLQEIETLLAAHFYSALRDPRATQERAGSVGANYQSAVTYRLMLTHYGQMAMALDETGTLELINAGKTKFRTVGVTWVGKTPTEATEEAGEEG